MKYDIQLPDYDVQLVPLESGQIKDWGHQYLRAQEFYGTSRGEGCVIFILDTAGTFSDHPDLVANCIPELDRVYTSEPAEDGHGHGTHCAGISCGTDNGIGVIGIAPGAGLVAHKVLTNSGSGSFGWVARSIREIADMPAEGPLAGKKRIVSMSLGGPAGVQTPAVLDEAIRYAVRKGVFIVAAAGNSGFNGRQSTVGAPGNHPLVISVAATSRPGNTRAPYSSGGGEVDVTAPGTGVYSTHKNGGYARLSGTSMACPQVSGVLALLLSANPEIVSQQQAMAFLTANATDILAAGRDDESGWGSPVLTGYLGQDPGDGPGEEDPVDEDPVDEEPEDEPEKPEVPLRPSVGTGLYSMGDAPLSLFWRAEDERGMKVAVVTDVVVEVTSKVRAEAVAAAVKVYARQFFSNRAVVLKAGQDLLDCAVWTSAFLQFISDDQQIVDEVGFPLNLFVEQLTITDMAGNQVSVRQEQIAARYDDLLHEDDTSIPNLAYRG